MSPTISGSTKYLGLLLDSSLEFEDHILSVVEKAQTRLNALKSLSSTTWGADQQVLKTVYVSWIRPVLEYSQSLFLTGSNKGRGIVAMTKLQNQALRIISGTNTMVSVRALEVECGIPPLCLRRVLSAVRDTNRILRLPHCFGFTEMWESDSQIPGAPLPLSAFNRPDNSLWVGRRASPFRIYRGVMKHLDLPTRYLPVPLFAPVPPWQTEEPFHCADPLPWPLLGAASTRTPEQLEKAISHARKVTEHYSLLVGDDGLLFFTDGSAKPPHEGGGSAASSILYSGILPEVASAELVGRISDNLDAELHAILMSLTCASHLTNESGPKSVVVLTDCQATIKLAHTTLYNRPDKWRAVEHIQKEVQRLHEAGSELWIDWVPAHCGLAQNELADAAAKQALGEADILEEWRSVRREPTHACLMFYAKQKIKSIWQKWWDECEVGRLLFSFRPSVRSRAPACLSNPLVSKRDRSILARLRLGNATTYAHLHRQKIIPSEACQRCGIEKDSVDHHLHECTATSLEREALSKSLKRINPRYTILNAIGIETVPIESQSAVIEYLLNFIYAADLHNLFIWNKSILLSHNATF